MDQKKIGAFLKKLRKEKQLTQEQLAEYLNVSGRTVSRWETGSNLPDLDILILLSDYYEVEIRELLDGERRCDHMNQEQAETILKVADYSSCREKLLIRNVHAIVVSGLLAWCASFAFMSRFLQGVEGAAYLFLDTFICILVYSAALFCAKANRTTNGYLTALIGAFTAITLSNLALFVLFYSTGSYYNWGIAGAYYSFGILAAAFLAAGIIVTAINRKRFRQTPP